MATGNEKNVNKGNQQTGGTTMSRGYECRKCGHEVYSDTRPEPIKWTDGHVCSFRLMQEESIASEPKQEAKKVEQPKQEEKVMRTITQNVMESFFNAKPTKMKDTDYDGFAGIEGQGYWCEDDKLLYVADVNGDDLVIESYTMDGEPRDMLVFKLQLRFRDGQLVEDYSKDEQ